jgi:FMN phosphatase YigB (HAD superfamily)
MFWFRPDALRQLFGKAITLVDFAPESGQVDGTIAHGIERIVCQLAVKNGYSYLEIEKDRGRSGYNLSQKSLNQYNDRRLEYLLYNIDKYDTVSFNINNTLVCLPLNKEETLYHYIENCINQEFNLTSNYCELRIKAERILEKRSPLYQYNDIQEILYQDESMKSDILEHAYSVESGWILDNVLPREDVITAFRYAERQGKRVIIITDSPYPESLLLAIFNKLNIHADILIKKPNSKCDYPHFWDSVIKKEGLVPERTLHIGSNECFDLQQSGIWGIIHYHVMSPINLFLTSNAGINYFIRNKDLCFGNPIYNYYFCRTYNSPFMTNTSRYDNAECVGYAVFGPLVLSFCFWLYDLLIKNDSSNPLIFNSDCIILDQVFNKFIELSYWFEYVPNENTSATFVGFYNNPNVNYSFMDFLLYQDFPFAVDEYINKGINGVYQIKVQKGILAFFEDSSLTSNSKIYPDSDLTRQILLDVIIRDKWDKGMSMFFLKEKVMTRRI